MILELLGFGLGVWNLVLGYKVYSLEKRINFLEGKDITDKNYADTQELLLKIRREMRLVMSGFDTRCEDCLVSISYILDKYDDPAKRGPRQIRHIYLELVDRIKEKYEFLLGEQPAGYVFNYIHPYIREDAYLKVDKDDVERQGVIKRDFKILVSVCPQGQANEQYRKMTESMKDFKHAYKPVSEKARELLNEAEDHFESRSLRAFKLENHPKYYNQLHNYKMILSFLTEVNWEEFKYTEYLTVSEQLIPRAVYLGLLLRLVQISAHKFASTIEDDD
jgi:hypothetical protein